MLRMSPIHRGLTGLLVLSAAACGGENGGARWLTAEDHESHSRYFPIDRGAHEWVDCNACHGDFDSFTEFSCIGCHEHDRAATDPAHDAVPDYVYSATGCFDCHPKGEVEPGVDHGPFFPVGTGSAHAEVRCAECHTDPSDREVVLCVGCHHEPERTRSEHAEVGGYLDDSPSCMKCHFRSEVSRLEDHTPFRIEPASPHGPGDATCLECHDQLRTDSPFPAADFTASECTTCHVQADMDPAHVNATGYTYANDACLSCHPAGDKATAAPDHDPFFPILAPSPHQDVTCAECHMTPSDYEQVNCVGCHHEPTRTRNEHGRVGDYAADSPSCMKCHYRSEVPDVDGHLPFRIDSRASHRPSRSGCLECHPSQRTGTAFPAADFELFSCTGCHSKRDMDDEHDDERRYRYDSPTCVQSGCHPNGEEND